MAAPDSVHDGWTPTHQLSLDLGVGVFTSAEVLAIADSPDPDPAAAVHDPGTSARSIRGIGWRVRPPVSERSPLRPSPLLSESERQYLEAELSRTRVQGHHQSKRIRHLEQALDQTLAHLETVRQQVQDQQGLENQLATVEDYANVQQQAITRLKQQLAEQQTILNQLQAGDGLPLPHRRMPSNASLQLDSYSLSSEFAGDVARVIAAAQAHIEALNSEIEERTTFQARLQHTCQELSTDRDQLQSRMTTLEQQNAELQEQILKQMKQISDYETGLQHWKDRYGAAQQQLTQLRLLLERLIRQRPDGLMATEGEPEARSLPPYPTYQSDLSRSTGSGLPGTPPLEPLPLPHESASENQLLEFLRRFRNT